MRKYIFIPTLVLSLQVSAQNTLMFDTLKIDASSKLIGRYPQYDSAKTYRGWNFIIDNPIEIKDAIKYLTVGKEVRNSIEDPCFTISLIQNKEDEKSWTINPTLKSALYDGHTYKFDIDKVKKLSEAHPFDYRFDIIKFSSKDEYNNYLTKQKTDTTFLFGYAPMFKYEGSFEVQFPRNDFFNSPKAISDYLAPLIEKIVSKDDYDVSYALNEKNLNDQNQFTMTITGSRKLFDNLQLTDLKKENWEATVEEGWFFYRIK